MSELKVFEWIGLFVGVFGALGLVVGLKITFDRKEKTRRAIARDARALATDIKKNLPKESVASLWLLL